MPNLHWDNLLLEQPCGRRSGKAAEMPENGLKCASEGLLGRIADNQSLMKNHQKNFKKSQKKVENNLQFKKKCLPL